MDTERPVPAPAAHRPGPPRRRQRPATLQEAFSPRRNSIPVLRVSLAGVVAVAHGLDIGYGTQPVLGRVPLADLAVDAFFVLSGFLVAGSYLRLASGARYTWHRFLRIMPGFWVCLLVTALLVAPLAAVLVDRPAASVFTGSESAWRYVVVNAALPMVQFEIADIAAPSGEAVFDGALWTLAYEAFCYGLLLLLGAAGLRRGRRTAVLGLLVAVWLAGLAVQLGALPFDVPVFDNQNLARFLLVFCLGVAGCLYADRLPVRWDLAAACALVVAVAAHVPDSRLVAAPAFAYLCLYAVVRLPLRWDLRWDLSYGLYIYHWPIQFLALLAGWAVLPPWLFVVVTVALGCLAASVSWLLVERPALRMKDVPFPVRRRRPEAATRA